MQKGFVVAVKAVIVRENRVLVLQRSKEEMEQSHLNKHQKWDLPGGGVYFHEKSEDGLHREIWEETHLQVEIKKPISLFDVIRNQVHLCIFTYAAVWKGGEVCLSHEHETFDWFTLEEVEKSSMPYWLKRDILQAFIEVYQTKAKNA